MVRNDQTSIPVAYVRGGSSKALFFHESDIPPAGALRNAVLKRVMGTPDPLQIDGMGGTKTHTSKIAIIKASERPDVDVDYTFAQVGMSDDLIGYDGNCGNISSGVGPFAIDERLVKTFREGRSLDPSITTQEVRIYHTGTKKNMIAHVPIDKSGYSVAAGDFEIAAVPGKGAPILLDYRATFGASRNKGLLPSGKATDEIEVAGKKIKITICDVANICVFVAAEDLGVSGNETAAVLTEDARLKAHLLELRGKAAQLVGMCKDWEKVDEQSPYLPLPMLVAPPPPHDKHQSHVSGRLFVNNLCHDSMAGTGSVCFTAASRIKGSVVYNQIGEKAALENTMRISHPLGMIPVAVEVEEHTRGTSHPSFKTLSFVRTSRRLMDGQVYVPKDVFDPSNTAHESQANGLPKDLGKTNGVAVNGTSKTEKSTTDEIPVTKILARFISSTRSEILTPTLRAKLKELIIDYLGVTVAATQTSESTPSIYNGILALGGSTGGSSTVLTKGKKFTPQYAALLNATFGHSMDFDDTYADGALHAGVTAISTALAQAELLGASCNSETFLAAIAVGYEITCRLGRELSSASYSRGFHNTSTAGLFGAIATIAVLKNLPPQTVEMAFGLAGSKAAGSMQYLDNGSWNKRLHPGFAAHDAFLCVALAEAGVIGATRPIEGKFGFLHAYSPNPNMDLHRLTANLGSDWAFVKTSLKPYPACRMTHCFIEMAGDMGRTAGETRAIQRVTLTMTPANHDIVGERSPNKLHPTNVVDAQFSAYYQFANAWLYGSNTGVETYTRLKDPHIHDLCDKVHCVADASFQVIESLVRVEFVDGKVEERKMMEPLGEDSHPFTREEVDRKFLGLMGPVFGGEGARRIMEVVDRIEAHSVGELLGLLE